MVMAPEISVTKSCYLSVSAFRYTIFRYPKVQNGSALLVLSVLTHFVVRILVKSNICTCITATTVDGVFANAADKP